MTSENWTPGITIVVGDYRPLREADLSVEARSLIGKRLSFHAGWRIERGPYAGRWALTPAFPSRLGWIPDCDLAAVEVA